MKNILVALDFSEASAPVVARAEEMARLTDAKVWLVHVAAPEPDFVGFDVGPQYVRDSRAGELRHEHQVMADYRDHLKKSGLEAESLLIQGPTVRTLLEEAKKLEADLIVIGARSHSFIYEQLIGSVFREVASRTEVPLLVVPAGRKKKA